MKQDIIHTSQTTWGVEGGKIDNNFTEIYSSVLASQSLLVKKIGDTCAVLTNYNSTYNLLIRFKYCLANHLYTFSEVGLLAKSKNRLLENIDIQCFEKACYQNFNCRDINYLINYYENIYFCKENSYYDFMLF